MLERIEAGADPLGMLNARKLKLFKDSENRAWVKPKMATKNLDGVA